MAIVQLFINQLYQQLKEKYIDSGKVQIEFIDYPLDRLAVIAASLARTLPNDGYIEAINILLKKQKQWAYSNKPLKIKTDFFIWDII